MKATKIQFIIILIVTAVSGIMVPIVWVVITLVSIGDDVGLDVNSVGALVGFIVGCSVGLYVGSMVGPNVGSVVGSDVGSIVGSNVGSDVGP